MKKPILLILIILLNSIISMSQPSSNGQIKGRIFNSSNNEPVPFANVVIWQTTIGSSSDFDGNFTFTGVKPGYVELRVSAVGYETYISEEILVTNAKIIYVDIPLVEKKEVIEEVKVVATPFRRAEESPVSLRRIGIAEIEKNPGGNRDISKVIQSFPGISSTASFRNDLIVRGGGPNENSFYLDDVEIPNLNHFSTQGASGGPVGILNVDFIREVNYYSGAFPASRGDALSSVFDFKQKDGNKDKFTYRTTLGASDLGFTMDGPLSENTTMILSARRSYLQFLFSVIGLPFLPTYNDVQFKVKSKLDDKNELTFIGLGALDQFELNTNANETEEQRYILKYLPVNEQWSYTIGGVYKHYGEKGFDTWVLSRNYLNNIQYKYRDNIETDSLKLFDYKSEEIENKLRYERTTRPNQGLKINYGISLEQAIYTNKTYQQTYAFNDLFIIDYDSRLELYKWGGFGQVSQTMADNRLTLSLGLRADGNDYNSSMANPLNQLSPRFSASYRLFPTIFTNFNTGRYYQLPPYTTLGYRNNSGVLVNKSNGLQYIISDHIVSGFEYIPNEQTKLSIEGFVKLYQRYPFSVKDSISLASKGGGFGTFGDEEVLSIARGRSYGMEVLYRKRVYDKLTLVLSYTLVRSEFKEYNGQLAEQDGFIPSSWDNKHILNITSTRNFARNWDVGFKWRLVGGAPYTPYDEYKSSLVEAWDVSNQPYLDYSRFNQLRFASFHQLDIRVDKQYFFDKWSMLFYLDIQNFYNFKAEEQARLTIEQEDGSVIIVNPNDPADQQRYALRKIPSEGQGTVLPTLGVIIEF